MTVRKILTVPNDNEMLRSISAPVVDVAHAEIVSIISDLKDTLASTVNGIGLAAPQIGVLRRVFVMDFGTRNKPDVRVVINPKIIMVLKWQYVTDGCLSIPNLFTKKSKRPTMMNVEYINEKGQLIRKTLKDVPATCFAHEVDHLDGILFIDKLSEKDILVDVAS